MVSIGSLWLAIILSAAFVWIVSALVWMVLPHHKKDFSPVPDEEATRQALRGISEGTYMIPYAADEKAFKVPEFVAKMKEGPVGYLTVVPNGPPAMGGKMVMSFAFYVLVAFVVAYLATQAMGVGTEYMDVFQFTSTAAWAAFGLAVIQDGVWFGRPWSHIAKGLFDAMMYGVVIGGVFGWLWP